MAHQHRSYIPAAGRDWLLPFYDPLQRWVVREASVKRPLVEQARIRPGHRVLDLGCGTGSLTVLVKQLHPEAEVIGLDPDPRALERAARKARRAALEVHFELGYADDLPHPDGSFDRVFSSFMFHHLGPQAKRATLREVRRVLRPEGSLHLLDFGPPRGRYASALGGLLHRAEHLRDNLEGRVPVLMRDSGLTDAAELVQRSTLFGSISYYSAGAGAAELRGV
jgi:ubiquinone/menaquinone biosynthesis C-methylase UbiE